MIIESHHLQHGKYYKCIYNDKWHIFRYMHQDRYFIFSFGYEISEYGFLNNDRFFCDIDWYNKCIKIEEVFFDDIKKYFPHNHTELILDRQKKINSLLLK